MNTLIRSMRTARLMEKGNIKSGIGDYETALGYYRMSLDYVTREHESMFVYYCLAHTLAKLGRYDEARKYADRSLQDCERFSVLGEPVRELETDVREVLKYVEEKKREEKET